MEAFLRSLEQERDWERAAAVALFNLDIRRAIQILNRGAADDKGQWWGRGQDRCAATTRLDADDQADFRSVLPLVLGRIIIGRQREIAVLAKG